MDEAAFIESIKGTRYVRTALYRHFDAVGALLYVGISLSAMQRLAQHKQTAHWFDRIVRVDIDWHASRPAALAAEARAIANENPAFNVARPKGSRPEPESSRGATVLELRGWAIVHRASGRRDGNYFFEEDVHDMLAWWSLSFPRERFELEPARGAAIPALRAYEASEWASTP